jgi:signal transduction histidine kinase/DNA-binding response OmpR family regulator
LVLFTVLPVVAVFSILFWLGVSHVRDNLSSNAQRWLVAHAQHQASRLALVLSQIPLLAQSLGDLVLAEPGQSQTLMYAHLIDGLRRTPIAQTAAIAHGDPERGAVMNRGEPAGHALPRNNESASLRAPGWQINGKRLRFNRPIYRQGQRVGDTWVESEITDLYAEIERRRSPSVTLFISRDDGALLNPAGMSAEFERLATMIPLDTPANEVQTAGDSAQHDSGYWLVSTELPGSPWRITAVTPTSTALQTANREASMVAVALLLALAVVVVIIGTVARQITRPLAELNAAVRQISQGDFTVAPEVTSSDELGALATAIRRMGAHIADRETQLHNAYEALEQRVAERTSALQDSNVRLVRQIEETRKTEEALRLANEEAQQANRAKSEFLSNMSHELRTPLHGVLGYAQILQRDAATSPAQRENLEAIERCGQHLLTLINDILDMTRIEVGQMKLDIQATDLQQLLEDVRMIVAQRADSKGLQLHVSLAPSLPSAVYTDAVKLKQILLNLLGNAVKFTQRGSVTLRAELNPDKQLVFEVTDTGIGIPADKIGSIFDPFHQAQAGQAVDGTGLGLAINQRLIGLLGGETFRVESKPGAGSRFRFQIPYQPAPEGSLGNRTLGENTPAGRRRLVAGMSCSVLVVDRLAENRKVLETLLRHADCEVETLDNLTGALQRLGEKTFDLILLDLRQVDQEAAESASTVRHAAFGSPKLVAVSASVLPASDQVARDVGFDAFLAKPFSDEQLFGLIDQLLDIRFEIRPEQQQIPFELQPEWPSDLAIDTAHKIDAAIDLGDIASLFQLAEELAENPDAPHADAEHLALMARMFDFDGLRKLSGRILGTA